MSAERTVVVVIDCKFPVFDSFTSADGGIVLPAAGAVDLASVSALSLILRECSKMS